MANDVPDLFSHVFEPKTKPVCPQCSSDQVTCDAVVEWDKEANAWSLVGTYDAGICLACENQTKHFNWVEIK